MIPKGYLVQWSAGSAEPYVGTPLFCRLASLELSAANPVESLSHASFERAYRLNAHLGLVDVSIHPS
jgi:hypothetical protein